MGGESQRNAGVVYEYHRFHRILVTALVIGSGITMSACTVMALPQFTIAAIRNIRHLRIIILWR